MSDQSQKGGGADDLLSKLFSQDDQSDRPPPVKPGQKDPFSGATRVEGDNTSEEPTVLGNDELFATGLDSLKDDTELFGGPPDDKTEMEKKPVENKASLEEFLGGASIQTSPDLRQQMPASSAPKPAPASPQPKPKPTPPPPAPTAAPAASAPASAQPVDKIASLLDESTETKGLGDDIFDGILEEGAIEEEKINFFDTGIQPKPASINQPPSQAKPTAAAPPPDRTTPIPKPMAPKQNPFENEPKENTILLENPLPDPGTAPIKPPPASTVHDSTAPHDPIEEALRQFGGNNAQSEAGHEDPTVLLPSPVETAAEPIPAVLPEERTAHQGPAPEASASDFAEVFSSPSIQVPDVSVAKPKLSKAAKRNAVMAAASLVALVIAGGIYFKLKTDEGFVGFHLEGWTLMKAYRPPSADQLAEFSRVLKDASAARLSGDLHRVEESTISLKEILHKDVRNLEAAGSFVDSAGMMMAYNGPASSWPSKLDEMSQTISSIRAKLKSPPHLATIDRAQAWRGLAVGDLEKSAKDLEAALKKEGAPEEETLALLAEIAYRRGQPSDAEKWISQISSKSDSPRLRFLDAYAKNNQDELHKLASENYLPAKIMLFVNTQPTKDNMESQLKASEQLAEEVKEYPFLLLQLKSFRGDLLAMMGEDEKAREEWKSIVEHSARRQDIWMKLAQSYEDSAMWDEAIDAYHSAEKAGEFNETMILRYTGLLRLRGKVVDALTVLDKAIQQHPKSAALYYQKGKVQLTIYQEAEGKTSFLKALELDPKFEAAILGLADLAFQQKEWNEVEALLKKIPESSPNYAEALKGLGKLADVRHEDLQAEHFYTEAIHTNPRLESVYPELVKIYLNHERDAEAEDVIRSGLKVLPRSAILKVCLARIYQFQNNLTAALETLKPIRKTYEHLLEVQFAAADILLDHKDYQDAWDVMNPLIVKEIRDPELLYLRAKAYYLDPESGKSVGSVESAYRLLDNALHQDPENTKYRILAAQMALRMQDKTAAIENIEYVLRYKPDDSQAHMIKGDIANDAGDYEKASHEYQEAMKYTRFRSPIYRRLADSYKQTGKFALAIKFYTKITEEKPDDAQAYLELGKLYNQDGRYTAAMANLKKAIELNPKVPEAYYILGFIEKELGEKKSAIAHFEKFLSLDPSAAEAAAVKDEVFFLQRNLPPN